MWFSPEEEQHFALNERIWDAMHFLPSHGPIQTNILIQLTAEMGQREGILSSPVTGSYAWQFF